jgi:Tetratricopeptide repeat
MPAWASMIGEVAPILLLFLAMPPSAVAARASSAAACNEGMVMVALNEQQLPPEEMPSAGATGVPEASPEASPAASAPPAPEESNDANWNGAPSGGVPEQGEGAAATGEEGKGGTAGPPSSAAGAAPPESGQPGVPPAVQAAPQSSPTEAPPPYDVGSVIPTAPVSDQPLTSLIDAAQSQPTLDASLRATEQGRQALERSKPDDAIRDFGRAVSIDPTDPYAYFYLGRAYMMKKDCPQALAFFARSEVGLRTVPAWLGEAKSYEGACLEEQGKFGEAAEDYKQALDAAPGNLMARAGYGRVTSSLSDANVGASPPPAATDIPAAQPASSAPGAPPPPESSSAITPPPEEAPPASAQPGSDDQDN